MKQEEKTRRTRERILQAAMEEFGTRSYQTASINTICNANGISKGLLYHNYENKDALYLACVERCIHMLTAYLQENCPDTGDMWNQMEQILQMRQEFFRLHPRQAHLFFQTVLQPPQHLTGQIHELRQEFDNFYLEKYQRFLQQVPLREGVSAEAALQCFMLLQEVYNGYFQNLSSKVKDFSAIIDRHEGSLPVLIEVILYGISERPGPAHADGQSEPVQDQSGT